MALYIRDDIAAVQFIQFSYGAVEILAVKFKTLNSLVFVVY